jgi:integrase
MPKLRLKDNPRPCFTADEFHALCAAAAAQSQKARLNGDHKLGQEWEELEDFLIFMVATFLRAGEWKELRQRHCRIVECDHPYLEVTLDGKTRERRVVSMPEAISIFRLIVNRDGPNPDSFLFKSQYLNRDTAQERIRDRFEALLKDTGLALNELGHKRTIYSLRHTALMFRLLHGDNVDLMMLARNAGTSVGQLDRFYLSHAHAAMKVENLHSMKPRREVPTFEPPNEEPRSAIQLDASIHEPFVEAIA